MLECGCDGSGYDAAYSTAEVEITEHGDGEEMVVLCKSKLMGESSVIDHEELGETYL